MYQDYWGLSEAPFAAGARQKVFRTSSYSEATARLQYLMQSSLQLGVLFGDEGGGKSTLLSDFGGKSRRAGFQVCYLSVEGIALDEFLGLLVRKLGGIAHLQGDTATYWRLIQERIAVSAFQNRGLIFLMDNLDKARRDVQQAIARLLAGHDLSRHPLKLIVSVSSPELGLLLPCFSQRCDLRIELEPWTVEETATYLKEAIVSAGRRQSAFDLRALEAIHHLSGGNPRLIHRLAELALVAGAAEQLHVIDVDTVQDAFWELQVTEPAQL